MPEDPARLKVGDECEVTAVSYQVEGPPSGWALLYASGASSNVRAPFGEYACRLVAERSFAAVCFQFSCMEPGQRGPARPPVLEATWRSAIDTFRDEGRRLVVTGRIMGGRVASKVVADGADVDALALFAYPLRPPRFPNQWRDKHLPWIQVPTPFLLRHSGYLRLPRRAARGSIQDAALDGPPSRGGRPWLLRPQVQRPHQAGRLGRGGYCAAGMVGRAPVAEDVARHAHQALVS